MFPLQKNLYSQQWLDLLLKVMLLQIYTNTMGKKKPLIFLHFSGLWIKLHMGTGYSHAG